MERRGDGDYGKDLSKQEKLAIYFKRYGFAGVLAFATPFLVPIGMDFLSNAQTNAVVNPIRLELKEIKSEIMYNRTMAASNDMRTLIMSNDWNTLVRHRVRSQSIDKVKEIMTIWPGFKRDSDVDKKRLWTIVKNILYKNTNIYVNELNRYRHPVVGDIGAYLAANFPMYKDSKRAHRPDYSFFAIVYRIVIESKDKNKELVEENLMEYMKSIQDEFFTDTTIRLKELETKEKIGGR